jgi:hypothetical protein
LTRLKIIIATKIRSPRLDYILDWVFGEQFDLDWAFAKEGETSHVSYGDSIINDSFFIPASAILSDEGIFEGSPEIGITQNLTIIFPAEGDVPFDIFGAIFFMLSRMEEYQPFTPDKHGRFSAAESLAFKKGFLERPVVDEWLQFFRQKLNSKFPELNIKSPEYSFHSTLDIDRAFLFKYKSFPRFVGGVLKAFFKGRFAEVVNRKWSYFGLIKDPNDTFLKLADIHEKHKIRPKVFFLTGNPGVFDENLPLSHKSLQKVIFETSHWGDVCWHPSYGIGENLEKLLDEKRKFEKFIGKPVTEVRRHFLKISIPTTYRNFEKLSIKKDHSLAFADMPGFRAGTSLPFPFFDVENSKILDVTVYPFALMDTTFTTYLNQGPEECLEKVSVIISNVKKVGGRMEILWHNETLNNLGPWKGWGDVLEQIIKMGK